MSADTNFSFELKQYVLNLITFLSTPTNIEKRIENPDFALLCSKVETELQHLFSKHGVPLEIPGFELNAKLTKKPQ